MFEALAGASGPEAVTRPSIDRTLWRLVNLGGTAFDPMLLPIVPFLDLRAGGSQFTGSDGCNRAVGSYRQSGAELAFTVGAVTRLACPGVGELTTSFTEALRATRAWRLVGDRLELLDANEAVLAGFEPQR